MAGRILAILVVLGMFGALSALSGCNTIAGAGKDIQKGGEAIHDEAKETQKKM